MKIDSPLEGQSILLHSEQTPLNETDKLLRDLADLAKFPEMNPGAVCHMDKTGTILLANKAARQLFGNENIVGQNWNNICPDFGEQQWTGIANTLTSIQYERDIGGSVTLFTFLRPDNGNFIFVYGSDVTAFRLTERQLASSLSKHTSLVMIMCSLIAATRKANWFLFLVRILLSSKKQNVLFSRLIKWQHWEHLQRGLLMN